MHFVTVGRLERWKGVRETLRAFAQIAGQFPDAHLTIIGDGTERESLQALARDLAFGERIRFTGMLAPDDVREQLQKSDVFLQHSLADANGWVEGFGVSVAEASAMELPVVATNTGGIPDQVVHGKTDSCEPHDVREMARAMARLAGSGEVAT
jgi:glycosyltransferase involved in cell wall biosynthesis